ncbi:hypothetical protein [Streptomyces sp. 4N124]|uniref:hypothetical protein n=1 Tax=Streptomyces sp. 4N124 TaxID=3457420 RepID=UPI003FD3C96C
MRGQTETVYTATDLAAHQADPAEISDWARGHWIIESTVHWTKTSPSPMTPAMSATAPPPS